MKKKMLRYGWTAALILLMTGVPVFGDDTEALFRKGVAAYGAGDFKQSVEAFQTLADRGIQSGKLYYNLGNATLKQGRLGDAVLWYERALKRIPHDPDLRFNYDYALSLTRDARGPSDISFWRILFFWKYLFTPEQVQWISILFNGALWLALVPRRSLTSPPMKMLVTAIFLLAAVSVLTAGYNAYEAAFVREGVILAEEAPVRSGLTDRATELFRLHAGARVKIEREKEGYYRIRYSKEKFGWIQRSDVGQI